MVKFYFNYFGLLFFMTLIQYDLTAVSLQRGVTRRVGSLIPMATYGAFVPRALTPKILNLPATSLASPTSFPILQASSGLHSLSSLPTKQRIPARLLPQAHMSFGSQEASFPQIYSQAEPAVNKFDIDEIKKTIRDHLQTYKNVQSWGLHEYSIKNIEELEEAVNFLVENAYLNRFDQWSIINTMLEELQTRMSNALEDYKDLLQERRRKLWRNWWFSSTNTNEQRKLDIEKVEEEVIRAQKKKEEIDQLLQFLQFIRHKVNPI